MLHNFWQKELDNTLRNANFVKRGGSIERNEENVVKETKAGLGFGKIEDLPDNERAVFERVFRDAILSKINTFIK